MFAKAPALGITGFASDPCRLPVHNLCSQTRHIIDNQSSELKRSQRMLSIFALVLSLALAIVMCLLIASSPVSAMQIAPKAHIDAADGLVALGALLSLAASAGVGIALVKLQFRPARKR